MSQTQNLNTQKMPHLMLDPHTSLEEARRKISLYGNMTGVTEWKKHNVIMQKLYAQKRKAMAQLGENNTYRLVKE